MRKPPSRRVCWYGKLPSRGDFVGRGLPARGRAEWDAWLQRGLALAATRLDGAALRERLSAFAPWRYLVLPAPGEIWCGIMVASHDRVGRAFPLTMAERLAVPSSPHECAARLMPLLDAAAHGLEALEAAIAAMPPRTGQEFKPTPAWPASPASLWWPLAAADDSAPRAAAWPPEPELLLELLNIQPGLRSRTGTNGL